MLDKHVEDQKGILVLNLLKSAVLACFLKLAHVWSLFFVTIKGLIMLDKHVVSQNREFWR